jgi:tetratricopeptide (TPR) repeat protein
MKYFLMIFTFFIFTNILIADTITINRKLDNLEHDVKQIETNQINYKIEKDLLKETYSNNYEKINFFITLILGVMGILGYLGLKDMSTIKKEYEQELNELRRIKGEFDFKSKEFDSDKKKFDEDFKSIIKENEEQSRKIKFIEMKDKVRSLIKENSLTGALEFANEALNITDDDKDLLNLKGIILCRLNQMNEAVICFQLALKNNPNDSATILNSTECFYFSRNIDAAKELINKHKTLFEQKENTKLLELLKIIELFFLEKKKELLDIVKQNIDSNNLKSKNKYINGWDLKEALHFIHYQPESELKTIVQNIFWFYDAQISGETLLKILDIDLKSDYAEFVDLEEDMTKI